MKRRSRSVAIEPLGAVLRRDTDLRIPAAIDVAPIAFRDWEAAVGTRIAARARPVRLERGVLYVRAASSTWAQELALLADVIVTQLRARGLAVDSLRFRVGHVDAPERPPARQEVRTSPPEVPLPAAVREEVARVADPELREAIARAAAKNLGWQKALAEEPKPKPPPARPKPRPPIATGAPRPANKAVAATSTTPAARGPRSSGTGSAPPDRTSRPGPAKRRGTT